MKNLEQDRNISQEDFERLIEAVVSRINEREKEPAGSLGFHSPE